MRTFLISVASLCLATSLAAATAVTKILTNDADGNAIYAEITNTGTINATNRLLENDRLTNATKTTAIEGVLTGAVAAGMLVQTTLMPGDRFLAIDPTTGEAITVDFADDKFSVPTTSIAKWWIPGGVR